MIPLEQLREKLIRALLDNQEDAARVIPDLASLTDSFTPIGDLEGFDSMSAMEATLELSDLLGCEIDERIFMTRVDGRRPTIGDIVQRLNAMVNGQEA